MFKKNQIIKGTLILTISSILSRMLGFLYRIFLSNLIGAKGMGIFQLIFPVLAFCVALSCGGIQIAVSRFVAESKNKSQSFHVLISSLIMSLLLSVITFVFLYQFSGPVSTYILHSPQCNDLLKYASITIPLTAFHSCVSGYYLGLKKTFVPAWSAVFEQVIKVASLYILGMLWVASGTKITILIAVYSMIISEFAGSIFCLIALCGEKKYTIKLSGVLTAMKSMFTVSYVLTLNKIMLTFLQCVEAILVPIVLVKSGKSSNEALSIYGILVGMALPVITFPSALSNSVSTMILPAIASANTTNQPEKVKKTTELSIWFSMVTGIFCIGIFLFYGNFIGTKIFGHPMAGEYIKSISFLCPFMYLSITLGSILHGLGKTTAAFIHNVTATLIRVGCLWFLVPKVGIIGYLWGLLISNLAVALLHGFYISRFVKYDFSPFTNIIKPTAWLLYSLAVGKLLSFILSFSNFSGKLFDLISAGISVLFTCGIFLYFTLREWKSMSDAG